MRSCLVVPSRIVGLLLLAGACGSSGSSPDASLPTDAAPPTDGSEPLVDADEGVDAADPLDAAPDAPPPSVLRSLAAGGNHTCALAVADNSIKCWGANGNGQLGLGDVQNRGDGAGEMGANLPRIDLGAGRSVRALAVGYAHTCAILDDDSLKCWGANGFGQLGLGDQNSRGDEMGEMGDDLPSVDLGSGRTAKVITAGDTHTCALLDDDTIKCWGANNLGQLGLGNTVNRGDGAGEMGDNLPTVSLGRPARAVAAGGSISCAILDDGSVKCWGFNTGRLGLGDTANRGDNPGEMGSSLPAVDLGAGRTAVALAPNGVHTCALLDDASIKCWGYNGAGQLGLGDTSTRGDEVGEMGDALPAVELGAGLVPLAIGTGNPYSCALLGDGTIKCWGINAAGQLGLGDKLARGDAPGEMGDALAVLDLGAGGAVRDLAAGDSHTCAVLEDGAIKCWGANSLGQLGVGGTARVGDDPGEMGTNLSAVDLGP